MVASVVKENIQYIREPEKKTFHLSVQTSCCVMDIFQAPTDWTMLQEAENVTRISSNYFSLHFQSSKTLETGDSSQKGEN